MTEIVGNIRELAGRLNLSVTTVSRVLNGKSEAFRISASTRQKVLDAARLYQYKPNRIARGLKLEKTETLGLLVPDISNPFFASIARVIETESRKYGYSMILCDSQDDIAIERELLSLLAERKVDGIILSPVGLNCEHIRDLQQKNMPILVIDRYFPGVSIPYITTDNYRGAYQATEYIIQSGHQRLACIRGPHGVTSSNERVAGFLDAAAHYNIAKDDLIVCGDDFGEKNGYRETLAILALQKKPTALFALGNLISIGVLKALSEAEFLIPEDISLVTFDEQPYSAFLRSPMTTIEQPREQIARMAVSTLFDAILSGNKVDKNIGVKLEPRLMIRKSVRKLN